MPSELGALLLELRGHGLLGAEELRQRRPTRASTGFAALDALLGGGLPQGRVIELAGNATSAATAIAIRLLARWTTEGWPCALVDRPFNFDPRSASEAGVELSRLLWCRPNQLAHAARAADVVLGSGAFPLVVLDLVPPPAPPGPRKRERLLAEGAWVRLARRAEASRATLVVLSDGRGGPGAMAAATLQPVKQRARFLGQGPGRTFEGLSITISLQRNKLGLPPGTAELELGAPAHFPARVEPAPVLAPVAEPTAAAARVTARRRRGRGR
ncbi:MAG: hypothetical protein JST54_06120 [Deltaproteobacteria bacterium]|nr:hypothetical protein [Deltaproteobacteria bacterium]